MVKDHSDSEKGNPLPPHRLLLSINSKGSFICTIPQTGSYKRRECYMSGEKLQVFHLNLPELLADALDLPEHAHQVVEPRQGALPGVQLIQQLLPSQHDLLVSVEQNTIRFKTQHYKT